MGTLTLVNRSFVSLLFCSLFFLAVNTNAQQVALTTTASSTTPGASSTVNFTIANQGGAQPASVQWAFTYPSADVVGINVVAGPAATAANKLVSCSGGSGTVSCIAYGLNTSVISNGIIATATVTISPSTSATSVPIQVSSVITSSAQAMGVPATGTGTQITINPPTVDQTVTLSTTATPATAGGTSNLAFSLANDGGPGPASLQWSFGIPATSVGNISVTAGTALQAAGKQIRCGRSGDSMNCLAYGFDARTIADGHLATATVDVLTTTTGPIPVTMGAMMAAGPTGAPIGASGQGVAIPVSQPTTPTPSLSGLACASTSVIAPATLSCTVTVAPAAGAGGFTVDLASSTIAVGLPDSVTVLEGQTSAGFTASIGAVSTSFTAAITATAGTDTATFSFSIGTQLRYSITGTVGASGAGATLAVTGLANVNVTADSGGNFAVPNLLPGTYTLTPTKTGTVFTPVSRSVTVLAANITGVSFTSANQSWSASGSLGTAGAGATVNLTGAASQTVTADASGAFTFPGLYNGTYTITPTKSGATFSPVNKAIAISSANVTGVNFTTTTQSTSWSISGSLGSAGANATVNLTGAASKTVTANGSGAFTFTGVTNGSYTVTPTKTNTTFTPTSKAVSVSSANVTGVNFTSQTQSTATYTISGSLSNAGAGATVNLTGAATKTVTADSVGNFSFTGLANGDYVVTPTKPSTTFSPISRSLTVSNANITGVAFIIQAPTTGGLTVSGTYTTSLTTAALKVTSPVFSTTVARQLLLAFVAAGKPSSGNLDVQSVTGGGLTWTRVISTDNRPGAAEIWRAMPAGTVSNLSVQATFSKAVLGQITVVAFTGADTTGTNGSGAIGALKSVNGPAGSQTATVTTTRAKSMLFAVGNDSESAQARSIPSSQTMVSQSLGSDGRSAYWVQRTAQIVSSGSQVTIGSFSPSDSEFNLSAVEVKGSTTVSTSSETEVDTIPVVVSMATAEKQIDKQNVEPAQQPSGPRAELANVASGVTGASCTPGGLAYLVGDGLAGSEAQASGYPLPQRLAGTRVLVNGVGAPLLAASANRITFQCPVTMAEGAEIEVAVERENEGVLETTLVASSVMQAAAPGLFLTSGDEARAVVQINGGVKADGARRGEDYVTVYASGLGESAGETTMGVPSNRIEALKNSVRVVIGDLEVAPVFAGRAPGAVGLYQLNLALPADAPVGANVPMYLRVRLEDGSIVESNSVRLTILEGSSTAATQE